MIYGKKDYEDSIMITDFDINQVAKKIERIIKRDDEFPYAGYSIDHKTNLIKFYVKTGDGKEFIAFDPATYSYHVQNLTSKQYFNYWLFLQMLEEKMNGNKLRQWDTILTEKDWNKK